jgi:hypothetical protein
MAILGYCLTFMASTVALIWADLASLAVSGRVAALAGQVKATRRRIGWLLSNRYQSGSLWPNLRPLA